jgi:hypothetical protein
MTYLIPVNSIGHPTKGRVVLSVNGKIKQEGDLNQMIWKVPEMIAYLSRFYDLRRRSYYVSSPSMTAEQYDAILTRLYEEGIHPAE